VKKFIGLLFLVSFLSACDQSPSEPTSDIAPELAAPSAVELEKAIESTTSKSPTSISLLYKIQEPNIDPYESRIIITDKYIRLDDNDDGNEFVLVDREKQIVYSVSDENDAILVINHKPVNIKSPVELKPDTERTPDKNTPMIDGREIVHYIFKINGEACQDAMIAEGLMTEAAEAIAEYRRILAGQHAKTFNITPADLRNDCDMAMNIFHADRYLQFGLPVHERDYTGYQRTLIDFDDTYEPKENLFVLPEQFDQFSIDELQAPAAPTEEAPIKS